MSDIHNVPRHLWRGFFVPWRLLLHSKPVRSFELSKARL